MTDEASGEHEGDREGVYEGQDWTGRRVEVTVGPIAHGGHCVARHSGRVIFVRHALPGEIVEVEVTEDRGGSFCRADAVRVLSPSPDRVEAPCPHARPGGCGGCDFQHVSLSAQRSLKAAVIAEQLHRLAGIDWPVTVLPLRDTQHDIEQDTEQDSGLGWRRRIRYAATPDGQLGLRVHRSHQVIPLQACPLGAPGVGDSEALTERWPGAAEVEVATDDAGEVAILRHTELPIPQHAPPRRSAGQRRGPARRDARSRRSHTRTVTEQVAGPDRLSYRAAGSQFSVSAGGFWQTHPRAAEEYTRSVLAAAGLRPGDRVLDLYAGAGLFTVALATAVTSAGAVIGLEADRRAVADAELNLTGKPWAEVRAGAVTETAVNALAGELGQIAAVVLDPPRSGAGRDVMAAVLATGASVVVYVACDPAALARDIHYARQAGWDLSELCAFDAFSMTHHVECIATLRPAGAGEPSDDVQAER